MCLQKNRDLLLGRSMSHSDFDVILQHLKKDPVVAFVTDTKTEEIGPGVFRFKAEVAWNGDKVGMRWLGLLHSLTLKTLVVQSGCFSCKLCFSPSFLIYMSLTIHQWPVRLHLAQKYFDLLFVRACVTQHVVRGLHPILLLLQGLVVLLVWKESFLPVFVAS